MSLDEENIPSFQKADFRQKWCDHEKYWLSVTASNGASARFSRTALSVYLMRQDATDQAGCHPGQQLPAFTTAMAHISGTVACFTRDKNSGGALIRTNGYIYDSS